MEINTLTEEQIEKLLDTLGGIKKAIYEIANILINGEAEVAIKGHVNAITFDGKENE